MFDPKDDTDADIIHGILRATEIGAVVTYSTLSAAIAGDVCSNRRAMEKARRRAASQDGVYFSTVRGVGLRRMSEAEKVDAHGTTLARTRRMVYRDSRRLDSVDPTGLESQDRTRLVCAHIENKIIRRVSSKKGRDKLLAGVQASGELPTSQAVDFIMGKIEATKP